MVAFANQICVHGYTHKGKSIQRAFGKLLGRHWTRPSG